MVELETICEKFNEFAVLGERYEKAAKALNDYLDGIKNNGCAMDSLRNVFNAAIEASNRYAQKNVMTKDDHVEQMIYYYAIEGAVIRICRLIGLAKYQPQSDVESAVAANVFNFEQ